MISHAYIQYFVIKFLKMNVSEIAEVVHKIELKIKGGVGKMN